jgi:hypothetical protein
MPRDAVVYTQDFLVEPVMRNAVISRILRHESDSAGWSLSPALLC